MRYALLQCDTTVQHPSNITASSLDPHSGFDWHLKQETVINPQNRTCVQREREIWKGKTMLNTKHYKNMQPPPDEHTTATRQAGTRERERGSDYLRKRAASAEAEQHLTWDPLTDLRRQMEKDRQRKKKKQDDRKQVYRAVKQEQNDSTQKGRETFQQRKHGTWTQTTKEPNESNNV